MMHKLVVEDDELFNSVWKKEIKRTKDSRFLHRLHCIRLVEQGLSCNDVGKLFDETPRSVERWVRNFDDFGIEGPREDPIPGRPRKLQYEQYETLSQDIQKPPSQFGLRATRWNGMALATHIFNKFGETFSTRQCQRILAKLNKKSK